jgi:hypothetical protein
MVFPLWWAKVAVWILPLFGQDPAALGRNRDMDLKRIAEQEPQPVTTRINVSPYLEASEQAARCHASQLPGGDRDFPRLLRKWLFRFDRYSRIVPPYAGDGIEDDLFAGLDEDERRAGT